MIRIHISPGRGIAVLLAMSVAAAMLLLSTVSAAGVEMRWRMGAGASGCLLPDELDTLLEQRMKSSRTEGATDGTYDVWFEHSGQHWSARIEITGADGTSRGARWLKEVQGADCSAIAQYTVEVLVILITGDEQPTPPETPPTASFEVDTARTPSPPAPDRREATEAAPEGEAAHVGGGPLLMLVLAPAVRNTTLPGTAVARAQRQLQWASAQQLGRRSQFTAWVSPRPWTSERERDAWASRVARGALKAPLLRLSRQRPRPVDALFVPTLLQLRVQDGVRQEGARRFVGISAVATLRVTVLDVRRRRTVKTVEVDEAFFYAGSPDERQVAVDAVLARAVARTLTELRSEELFALTSPIAKMDDSDAILSIGALLGVKAGDAFHFVDARGKRSGYAIVRDAEPHHARAVVRKMGQGHTLTEAGASDADQFFTLFGGTWRLAYQNEAPPRQSEARSEPLPLGRALELGAQARNIRSLAPGARWAWLWELAAAAVAGDFLGASLEQRIGFGCEILRVPSSGIVVTPTLRAGLLQFVSKQPFAGVTASAGLQVEVHRGAGEPSTIVDLTGQMVGSLPVMDSVALPPFHGVTLSVGWLSKSSRYEPTPSSSTASRN